MFSLVTYVFLTVSSLKAPRGDLWHPSPTGGTCVKSSLKHISSRLASSPPGGTWVPQVPPGGLVVHKIITIRMNGAVIHLSDHWVTSSVGKGSIGWPVIIGRFRTVPGSPPSVHPPFRPRNFFPLNFFNFFFYYKKKLIRSVGLVEFKMAAVRFHSFDRFRTDSGRSS